MKFSKLKRLVCLQMLGLSVAVLFVPTNANHLDQFLFGQGAALVLKKVECASFVGASAWLVLEKSDKILYTNDAGLHWKETGKDIGQIQVIDFLDAQNGWAVTRLGGLSRVWITSDSGDNWVAVSNLPQSELRRAWQLKFVDPLHGWILDGSIWRTVDGGLTWKRVLSSSTPGVSGNPVKGAFPDAMKAFVIGEHGEIYSTTNGGTAWESRNVGMDATLTDIFFITDQIGWIKLPVSQKHNGEMYRTNDGGGTWQLQPLVPKESSLLSAYFVNQSDGWGVGQSTENTEVLAKPVILRTQDGGKSWEQRPGVATDRLLWDVYFVNAQNGWLIGSDGIYHTNNQGNTWRTVLHL